MRKITNATNVRSQNQSVAKDHASDHCCCTKISCVERVPAWISTPSTARPNAASYDRSCADARTDPSNGYFDPDDHPASITPYTPSPDIARMNSAPIGRSTTWRYVS